jgi:DNA mismatch repair protein MutS2
LRGAAVEGEALEEASREARRRVEQAAGRLRKPSRRTPPSESRPRGLTAGDPVRVHSTGSTGRIVEMREDRALVEAGAMRLEVPVSDLEPVNEPRPGKKGRGGWRGPTREQALVEVDLRGMRVDEMERELTRALDEAILGDLDELRIIHGKGTGALRQRAGEILEGDPRVKGFRMGKPSEGGAGVTIASF